MAEPEHRTAALPGFECPMDSCAAARRRSTSGRAAAARRSRKLRRTNAAEHRSRNRNIFELVFRARTAQKQPAAAHVPAPDKSAGEQEAPAEDLHERSDVFRRRDASEQNDLGVRQELFQEEPRIAHKRREVTLVVETDPRGRHFSKVGEGDDSVRGIETRQAQVTNKPFGLGASRQRGAIGAS